jgi:splicing factor 3B subunit 1
MRSSFALQVFWQIYSSLYMGAQDALVPYYPTSELFFSPSRTSANLACSVAVPDVSDERNDYEGRSQMLMMWV